MKISGSNRMTATALGVIGAGVLMTAASCGPGRAAASETINDYLRAVQTEDMEALYCLSAGAAGGNGQEMNGEENREAFHQWARAEFDAYYTGRDEGRIDLTSSGIVMVKAFTLGKGTFYNLGAVRSAGEGVLEVDMPIRFAYGDINISGLNPGTTFYVCGYPLGTMHSVTIPRRPAEERREVLNAIVVRWTLIRQEAAGGCEDRWSVNSVEPVSGTEEHERLVWIF